MKNSFESNIHLSYVNLTKTIFGESNGNIQNSTTINTANNSRSSNYIKPTTGTTTSKHKLKIIEPQNDHHHHTDSEMQEMKKKLNSRGATVVAGKKFELCNLNNSGMEATSSCQIKNSPKDQYSKPHPDQHFYENNTSSSSLGANCSFDGGDHTGHVKQPFWFCPNSEGCIALKDILNVFNAAISEDQAWALIFQFVKLYRDSIQYHGYRYKDLRIPNGIQNINLHNDGSVHINCVVSDRNTSTVTSQKKILMQIGRVIFDALDYNLSHDEDCIMSTELEQIISYMTLDVDVDDEGIERDVEDCDDKTINTKELDDIIQACVPRVKSSVADDHYKAVCRALATEALELQIFLQKVFNGDTESLRIKADATTSKVELDKLEFNDWARFWMQVVDELRRGVRLRKSENSESSSASVEYELTPYEILMGDIRARKYNLRKVMVNGDIPPRVKKDAHAVILEFIRSRPPLKKASDRKLLPPMNRNPSPREQLMDSIRQGRSLRPIGKQITLKNRLLPASQQAENISRGMREVRRQNDVRQSPRTKQRLIKVDFSLFRDGDDIITSTSSVTTNPETSNQNQTTCSQPRMPPYPHSSFNTEHNPINMSSVLRRTKNNGPQEEHNNRFFDKTLESYDLATQCGSRRPSARRHTIVGCQSHLLKEMKSLPTSRSNSRRPNDFLYQNPASSSKSEISATGKGKDQQPSERQAISKMAKNKTNDNKITSTSTGNCSSTNSNLPVMETWSTNSLDENQWSDKISDRLSLTLEEIVHIRSVMTKAELEGLPVGVRVKEDVERRKVCFLCLKTRFSIFGAWGVQCKLCQRTVCSKCYSKMRIPTEHFRNVPVVLLSPSLMGSPAGSSTPSPLHHTGQYISSTTLDDPFPKSLMERLLKPEFDRTNRNTVGSAPSSPKKQRSNSSTPGGQTGPSFKVGGAMTKSMVVTGETVSSSTNTLLIGINGCNKENSSSTSMFLNGGGPGSSAPNRQVAGIMSRSMEGPRSLPIQSPGRSHSNSSTLDRKNLFARAFTVSQSPHMTPDRKENLRGEMMAVCNDCRALVLEIIRSSRQTRSSARNRTLKKLTLDLSPVYKY